MAAVLVVVGTGGGVATPAHAAASTGGFVTARGPQLMLNGRPWYFSGYDMFELPSVAAGNGFNCGGYWDPSWLDTTLDEIKRSSDAAVVRTWFFQSYSYAQFDLVLRAAAARSIKILPVLVNQWGECEPNVNGGNNYKTQSWYQHGYRMVGDGYALSFRQYAINTAARYANNTTIAFWQLVNEAEAGPGRGAPCNEPAAAQAIRSFADDTAGAMKAVDPNHLINLGTLGTGQCGVAGGDYGFVNGGRTDICEYHDYGWGDLPGDSWNGVAPDIQTCLQMRKPIFAGEVGLDASIGSNWWATGSVTSQTLLQRATFLHQKMVAQFARGAVGFLVWKKSTGGASGYYDVGPGDPAEVMLAAAQQQLDLTGSLSLTSQLQTIADPAASIAAPAPGSQVNAASVTHVARVPAPHGTGINATPAPAPGVAVQTHPLRMEWALVPRVR